MQYEVLEITDDLRKEINSLAAVKLDKAMRIQDKLEKYAAIDSAKEEVINKYTNDFANLKENELNELITKVKLVLESIEYKIFRNIVVKEHTRADGRAMNEIRPLSTDIDLLPRTHGSALFTRGQTQSLSVVTLGALGEHQILDGLSLEDEKRFMLHYNFPQFSVGETGRYGAPGRREVGHGALGEKALLQVIPSEDEFPYTIRVVSETLESNGSSSQASICAGCMALMAAGVPIKSPVAGIAMGLISQDDECSKYTILTDIQGLEDHYGDMDFKVAGTEKGITALQMDIKIAGVSREVLSEALAQAHKARAEIRNVMTKAIAEPRADVGKYAPKLDKLTIDVDKIRDVIGTGGKVINDIIAKCDNVQIDIDDDGHVVIYHMDRAMINKAKQMIEDIVRVAQVGEVYEGEVTRVEDYGAFVKLFGNCEGLCHVS